MKVLIINGPMGVGKTTIGKELAKNNEGTAFIDGDWCLDIHPFVGNHETKSMAIDNILYMISNYKKCSVCKMVILVWLMDEPWVCQHILQGLSELKVDVHSVTLISNEENLVRRWKNDKMCEWRTDNWLEVSLKSLPYFSALENCIDTSNLSCEMIVDMILTDLKKREKSTEDKGWIDI